MPWLINHSGCSLEDAFSTDILEHWRKLALAANQGDPFCCAPVWNLSYSDVIAPVKSFFYEATQNSLVMFKEVINWKGEIFLAPFECSWLYGQPLLGPDAIEILLASLHGIIRRYGFMPPIFISGIQKQSFHAIKLYNTFSRQFNFYIENITQQASASLKGGLDGWFSRRSANHRAKLRKASRKAFAMGITFERHMPNLDNVGDIYKRILAIEKRSWKGIGKCGMTVQPSRDFYENMIVRLARNAKALVIFATLDGQDLGFIFGGLLGPYYRGQQFSYIKEAAKFSIGDLLQLEQIRWLCEIGIERYDMGPSSGERMAYKTHWTEEFREMQTWIMRVAL